MHEGSIAQGLLDTAIAALPQPDARIARFTVAAGPFSGVEEECLKFYLTELCKGTPADGAELVMRRVPAKLICDACGNTDNFDGRDILPLECAKCGRPNRIEGGNDLYLDTIDIESDRPRPAKAP